MTTSVVSIADSGSGGVRVRLELRVRVGPDAERLDQPGVDDVGDRLLEQRRSVPSGALGDTRTPASSAGARRTDTRPRRPASGALDPEDVGRLAQRGRRRSASSAPRVSSAAIRTRSRCRAAPTSRRRRRARCRRRCCRRCSRRCRPRRGRRSRCGRCRSRRSFQSNITAAPTRGAVCQSPLRLEVGRSTAATAGKPLPFGPTGLPGLARRSRRRSPRTTARRGASGPLR